MLCTVPKVDRWNNTTQSNVLPSSHVIEMGLRERVQALEGCIESCLSLQRQLRNLLREKHTSPTNDHCKGPPRYGPFRQHCTTVLPLCFTAKDVGETASKRLHQPFLTTTHCRPTLHWSLGCSFFHTCVVESVRRRIPRCLDHDYHDRRPSSPRPSTKNMVPPPKNCVCSRRNAAKSKLRAHTEVARTHGNRTRNDETG